MSIPAISATLAILTALGYVLARKAPDWYLHVRFARAFRAGRRFYGTYPHVAKDIAYGDHPRHKLDVYWPPEGDQLPVVLFVYGGSWSWGDKALYPLAGKRFIAHGFVAVVINYRLYPSVTFPAFVEDAAAAVAWTIRHIAGFHGDPARLYVVGHSAGGHILTLLALDDRYLAGHGLARHVIRGVIAVSAPTDLEAEVRYLEANPGIASADGLRVIMGGPGAFPLADPARHARAGAPPILLLHGARDKLVPIHVARNFAAALKAAGAPVEMREYPKADHYSIVLDSARDRRDQTSQLLADARSFLQKIEQGTRVKADKH